MGHGHDAQHGHGAGATPSAPLKPAELPPIPASRSITPAREDFERPWPGALIVWPFVWTGVAVLLLIVARSFGRPFGPHTEEHESGVDGEASPAGEPHGEPAMHEAPAK